MKQAVLLLCIALCVCVCAAQNEASTTSVMDSIIAPKASVMSGYRYGVERESMCFRSAKVCFKADNGPSLNNIVLVDEITCSACPGDHHGSYGTHKDDTPADFIADVSPPVSKCIWTLDELITVVPVTHQSGWFHAGTYTGFCYLEEDSKSGCKFPDTCEDTVLAIQGVIYEMEAVRLGAASSVTPTECAAETRRVPAGTTPGKAQIQAARDEDETKVKTGTVRVYSGVGQVHAGHPLKFKSVHHQYSYFTSGVADATHAEAEGLHRLGDRVHKFDFVGEAKPHY